MKDAFGGILNLVLIVVFLVIIEGILGFIVNYSKAFHMKDEIISIIEEYKASDSCFDKSGNSKCSQRIIRKADELGYHPRQLNCHNDYTNAYGRFCYKMVSNSNKKTYTIISQVDINVPIINNILGMEIFQVHGETRPM